MPYSVPTPAPAPLPIHSQGHPGHRRSYSDERGPGAFAPLGLLPRRTRAAPLRTGPIKFHFRNDEPGYDDDDDDDEESSASSHDDISNVTPALKIKPNNSFKLSLNTEGFSPPPPSVLKRVPFPRSSPRSSPRPSPSPSPLPSPIHTVYPPRPIVSRTLSTPILLSNGKPLKSSLKSSSSSPHIPLTDSQKPSHLRARSAPSTPHVDAPSSPITSKNVHFASKEDGGLESVRLFSRSARPVAVSHLSGDDTETETETDQASSSTSYRPAPTSFPFPHISSPLAATPYELHPSITSPVPSVLPPPHAHIHLESLTFTPTPPALTGSLLVRNLAYEKHVAVRFTLDDWHTTSEVAAAHAASLPALPAAFPLASASAPSTTLGDLAIGTVGWDRFAFHIRLEDYATRLDARTLWLVARYRPGRDGAEWWDNNAGSNYRVGFRVATESTGSGTTPLSTPLSTSSVQRPTILTRASYPQSSIAFPSFSPATLSPAHTTPASPSASPTSSSHPLTSSPRSYSPPVSALSTPASSTPQTPTEAPAHTLHTPAYTAAAAHTTIERLKKLNLKNYAAPAPAPVPSKIAVAPPTSTPASIINASSNTNTAPMQPGVRWPWGAAPNLGKESENIHVGGGVDPESIVYEAFVRKWCFAGGVGA